MYYLFSLYLKGGKRWCSAFILYFLVLFSLSAQTSAPHGFNYLSGESIEVKSSTDTMSVSFNGGTSISIGKHKMAMDSVCMPGFKYGLVYAPYAFEKDIFVSKGYYPDFIQLSWEIERFQNQVTAYKIYRRELDSGNEFEQVGNLASAATSWKDEYAESGVMYEYKLLADGLFPWERPFLNILTGVGFRLPSGKVSGRVTYDGGGAVKGVTLIAETDDDFDGASLELNGTDSYLAVSPPDGHSHFRFNNEFTFQGWFKPTSTTTSTLFQKGTQYKVSHESNKITFDANGTALSIDFTQKVDTFFHVTAIKALDSLRLYVMYDNGQVYRKSVKAPSSTPSNNDEILIGKNSTNTEYYKGVIDELRIWYKALSQEEVTVRSFMYIAGTEDSLSAYYRMNEGVGSNFYDLSRKGFNFNEKHGFMASSVKWSNDIPTRTQLAVKGYTDANGNYLISGVPYTSDGSTYRIVPAFGVHSFDPTERLMFIGPGSNVYSDVNFTDIASFKIEGKVFYKGTRFPVEGVQIKIDDVTAVTSEGLPITTDVQGKFVLDVPIGKHQLRLSKYGHAFRGGGYFPDSVSKYDFQQSFQIQTDFIDSTLIKVVGKVVGGPVEAAKSQGMGKTVNNIGKGKIVLTTQREWDLKEFSADSSGVWQNAFFDHEKGLDTIGTTMFKVYNVKPKEIEIRPDPTTGEYTAYLLPEKYVVKSIVAGNPDATSPQYTYDDTYHTTMDLSTNWFWKTELDSTVDISSFTVNPSTNDTIFNYDYDSLAYQVEKDFILRLKPQVSMRSADGKMDRFWEEKVLDKNDNEVIIVSDDNYGNWKTPQPVFVQRNVYKTKVTVFESYINVDKSNEIDDVPVVDGTVRIQNNLAIDSKLTDYDLNDKGELNYTFKGGLPNTAVGGAGSFLKSMTVKVFTGKGGSIVSDWPTDGKGFKGYVFGGMPTGNNFVSTGPNLVSMIIRDPHGTNSYAYYESGQTVSTETSFQVENGESSNTEIEASFGTEVITFAGVGAGVIIETKNDLDIGAGIEQSTLWTDNNTSVTSTTNTQRWETSSEPDYVGAIGDVFIGNSTNIVYGKNVYVELLKDSECGATSECIDLTSVNEYNIGISEGIRLSPEFNTGFQYTQNHIEYYLIPQLEELRDNFYLKKRNTTLASGKKEYECVFCLGNANYAKSNDTKTMTRTATGIIGDSYKINYPLTPWPADSEYVDSIAWFNTQIIGWENALRRNEKEKAEAKLKQNYSYDAGTIFESSTTISNSESRTETFEWTLNPSVSSHIGFDVAGIGASVEFSMTYNHTETETTTTDTTKTNTFGFVFNDGDEGDFYSIDVKDAENGTGPIFAVRGGQSMCPYIGAETTKYHEPGKILSEATMRREVPQISVSQAIVNNVPQGKSANFGLFLANVSETGDEAWYRLSIDESSITGGNLKIDGASIKDGRTFFIDGGSTLTKSLNLTQAVPDSFKFENVKIVLHSLCQFDPGDNWEDISDTVEISAYFQPACAEVTIQKPSDKWLVNTSTIQYDGTVVKSIPLNVGLRNYDLSHGSLEKLAVQYKSSSSSQWISDMVYYLDQTQYDQASAPKTKITTESALDYVFETKSLQDRNYDIRLQTQCADGTENTSETVSGIKDIKRPKLFGTPQPGDGILSPGDDIMITFDEDVQAGLLTSFNFSVRGVLNGADIAHKSFLSFDGVDDNATVIEGVNISDQSFTIEFWTQRLRGGQQEVVFAQGDLEIGFNAGNALYVKLGNQTVTTSNTYTIADDWMHFAVAYDHDKKVLDAFMNDQIVLDQKVVNSLFKAEGRVYVGQSMAENLNYKGNLHDLRVWETARGLGSVVSNMNKAQTGDKVGLSGFWPMDEATGLVAIDLSRNHHALLNGVSWKVQPVSYSYNLSGSEHMEMPSGQVVVTDEMDMTIEFWMKAGPQSNTVIFSNGKGDGTSPSPPFENIWVIGADASGKLIAMNNGQTLTVSKDVFDNEWHHVALVTKRIANTTIYVDGNQEAFGLSSNFGGFSGGKMTLGARQHNDTLNTFDQNFIGRLDEFRFWNLARTKKLIDLDKNAKLTGDEIGLLAYYPFDEYNLNLQLVASNSDQVLTSTEVSTASIASIDNTDSPNIKDARPVQKVRYDWVVNEDQIIINITEDPALIEKTVLEITVQDVEDLNENRLASPVTWTAYIKKNTVLWGESVLSFEKILYDPIDFNVEVLNKGGTEQNYEITNIPAWLEISEPTGTLAPDSKKILSFLIKESTNIGDYEQSLYLGSDFGFKEKLEIKLKVRGDEPDWSVNPSDYQYSMSVIGEININGILSTNPDDMIAAIVDGEIRGVAKLQYIDPYDKFEFFLDVYSNSSDGENIEFKVWNASEGKIQVDVTPKLTFEKNSVVGLPSAPQEFIVTENVVMTYPLNKGWNWLSFNVNAKELSKSSDLFTDLNSVDGDIVKTSGEFDQFGNVIGWIGQISQQGGFSLRDGYKMKVSQADTFSVIGSSIETSSISIPLNTGWTWIGFPSEMNMGVNDALANVNFQNGDFIKGQTSFAIYDHYLGWIGSLKYMKPREGYMIKTSASYSLSFPDPQTLSSLRKARVAAVSNDAPWSVVPQDYSKEMSFIIETDICVSGIDENDYLGVFVGDECRGVIEPLFIEQSNRYLFFLTAYANTHGETLSFRYYDASEDKKNTVSETYVFAGDAIEGSVNSPYDLTVSYKGECDVTGIGGVETLAVRVFPNPFNKTVVIECSKPSEQISSVMVTDVSGQVVKSFISLTSRINWDGTSDKGKDLPEGVYIISVTSGDAVHQTKLVKNK